MSFSLFHFVRLLFLKNIQIHILYSHLLLNLEFFRMLYKARELFSENFHLLENLHTKFYAMKSSLMMFSIMIQFQKQPEYLVLKNQEFIQK